LIDTELRAAGLHMVVAFGTGTGDARRQAIEGIEFLMERGCDGLLAMSNHLSDEDIAALGPKRSCVVLLNHTSDSLPGQHASAPTTAPAACWRRTLLERGHRKIAVIAGPSTSPDNVERIDGFLGELARAGIDTGKMWIAESDFSPEGGWASAAELVASEPAVHRAVLRQRRNGGGRAVVFPAGRHRGAAPGVGARLRRHAERGVLGAAPVDRAYSVARRDPQRPERPAQPLLRRGAPGGARFPDQPDAARIAGRRLGDSGAQHNSEKSFCGCAHAAILCYTWKPFHAPAPASAMTVCTITDR
jgi:hypothetical protein